MKDAKNELMQFVAGVVMLAVGLYIFSQKVIVFSGDVYKRQGIH